MWRLVINCLLLASIASAVPDGREKRSFSYIKNLIKSTLFGTERQLPAFPDLESDTDYRLYKVPGFEDVLIKAKPNGPIIDEEADNSEEVVKIHPFESYIGTNNAEDTLVTLQNVNNLLSTGIMNKEQNRLLKQTVTPMISNLNPVKLVAQEIIRPVTVVPKIVQPVVAEVVEPYEANVKIDLPFEPKYSYKQMENNKEVMTFTAHSGPEVSVRQRLDTTTLPMCIKERIDEVVALGAYPNRLVSRTETLQQGNNQYPSAINPIPVLKFNKHYAHESKKGPTVKIPLSPIMMPLANFNQPAHEQPRKVDSFKSDSNDDKVLADKIDVTQTLGPIPPQYISSFATLEHRSSLTNNENIARTFDDISREGVSHAINKKQDELNAKVYTDTALKKQFIYIPPVINDSPGITNNKFGRNPKSALDDSAVYHYSYKQGSYKNPNAFSVVRDKDGLKVNVDTDLPLHRVYVPPVIDYVPDIKEDSNLIKASQKEVEDVTTIKKTDSELRNDVHTHYVYKQGSHNNPNAFSIAKEKDELKVNVNTDLPQLYHTDSTLPTIGTIPDIIRNASNIVKPTDENPYGTQKTSSSTLLDDTKPPKSITHSNTFSVIKEKDELATKNVVSPPWNHNVNIPSAVNTMPATKHDSGVFKTVDGIETIKDAKIHGTANVSTTVNVHKEDTLANYIYETISHNEPHAFTRLHEEEKQKTPLINHVNISKFITKTKDTEENTVTIGKTMDIAPTEKTLSEFIQEKVSHKNPLFTMMKDGGELKTNVNTNSPLFNNPEITATTIKDELYTNKEAANLENASIISSTKSPMANIPATISFKNNPIVVPDSNYVYHQSNSDGSSIRINGHKDGVSVNVNSKPLSIRGDIPQE